MLRFRYCLAKFVLVLWSGILKKVIVKILSSNYNAFAISFSLAMVFVIIAQLIPRLQAGRVLKIDLFTTLVVPVSIGLVVLFTRILIMKRFAVVKIR